MSHRFQIEDLSEREQFDVKLQISLRANAINIMKFYDDKTRFEDYVLEREKKLRKLLQCDENPLIFDKEKQIFP